MKGDFLETRPGYCKCGCGEMTKITPQNCASRGWIKGEPKKFIQGHNFKSVFGKNAPNWKGGKIITNRKNVSYVRIYIPTHPRCDGQGYVFEHILIAEKALGKHLHKKAVVHHVDGDGLNNNNNNLVICQDNAYHTRLHTKLRRLKNARL